MTLPKKNTINVVTCLRYHDAAVAVDWLCRAFGFERQLVVPGEKEGTIVARGAPLRPGPRDAGHGGRPPRRL